jgi:hypothetical protein
MFLNAGVTANKEKCQFNKTELIFYGLKFSAEGISLDDSKLKAIKKTARPESKAEVRSLLGLGSYCARFMNLLVDC